MTSALVRASRYGPWSARAWRDTAFATAGVALALPVPFLLLCAVPYPRWTPLAAVALPGLAAVLTALQRGRFRALLGLEVPAVRHALPWYTARGVQDRLRSETTWRQLCYHALVSPLAALGAVAVVCCWTLGAVGALVLSWVWALPAGDRLPGWARQYVPVTVAGVALLLAAPLLAAAVTRVETACAAALLGPSRAERAGAAGWRT